MLLKVNNGVNGLRTAWIIEFDGKVLIVEAPVEASVVRNYDFAVWMILPYAICHQLDIEMEEPITDLLLFNVEMLQSYLTKYFHLNRIKISGKTEEVHKSSPELDIMIPFSGGIDSSFTAFYNQFELGREIKKAFFACGLDLDRETQCQMAFKRCRKILRRSGVMLSLVRTNYRRVFSTRLGWKFHSDFVLSGLLHLFDESCGHGFISGGGDGGSVTIDQSFQVPFLSEQLFHLFSNKAMAITPFDGANHSRIQKIKYISVFPEIKKHLRVCWKAKRYDNCGQCTKCVVAQLAFIAVDGEIPPCFGTPAGTGSIGALLGRIREGTGSNVDSPNVRILKQIDEINRLAEQTRVTHPYLKIMKSVL